MEFARDYFKQVIGKNAINEVKNVRQDDENRRIRNTTAHQWDDLSITDYVKTNWRNLSEFIPADLKRTNATAILRASGTKLISIKGDLVTLSCRHSFFKEKLEEPENKKITEKIMSEWLGHPVRVDIVLELQSNPEDNLL